MVINGAVCGSFWETPTPQRLDRAKEEKGGGVTMIFHLSCPHFRRRFTSERVPLSCGRYRIFPRELSSFRPGAEYPVELLWQSCAKPKLYHWVAPCTCLFKPGIPCPMQESLLYWSENKCMTLMLSSLDSTLRQQTWNPRQHNCSTISNGECTESPTGATRTQHHGPSHGNNMLVELCRERERKREWERERERERFILVLIKSAITSHRTQFSDTRVCRRQFVHKPTCRNLSARGLSKNRNRIDCWLLPLLFVACHL